MRPSFFAFLYQSYRVGWVSTLVLTRSSCVDAGDHRVAIVGDARTLLGSGGSLGHLGQNSNDRHMYSKKWVFEWTAFSAALGSWLLAVGFVSQLNLIETRMNWASIVAYFLITVACLLINAKSKTEIGFESNMRLLLLCLYIFVSWIILSWLIRHVSQVTS